MAHMKLLKEFKEFAVKGDFIDLAVGVIIGGAFGKIVSSLVNDIFMPIISVLTSNVQIRDLEWVLSPASGDMQAIAITYGAFLQNVLDFIIVAFCIFLFVRLINRARRVFEKEKAEAPAAPPKPTPEETLLMEIRDLLKKNMDS